MLKKENRLKKNRHYAYIYKKGVSVGSKFLTLVYLKTRLRPFKVGFSVSNKIGKSTVRNKVKRRLRESFKFFINRVNPTNNYIFVARQGIDCLNFEEIKNEMFELLKKAKVIRE